MKEELLQILTEAVPGVDFEAETALVDDEILDPWTLSPLSLRSKTSLTWKSRWMTWSPRILTLWRPFWP